MTRWSRQFLAFTVFYHWYHMLQYFVTMCGFYLLGLPLFLYIWRIKYCTAECDQNPSRLECYQPLIDASVAHWPHSPYRQSLRDISPNMVSWYEATNLTVVSFKGSCLYVNVTVEWPRLPKSDERIPRIKNVFHLLFCLKKEEKESCWFFQYTHKQTKQSSKWWNLQYFSKRLILLLTLNTFGA